VGRWGIRGGGGEAGFFVPVCGITPSAATFVFTSLSLADARGRPRRRDTPAVGRPCLVMIDVFLWVCVFWFCLVFFVVCCVSVCEF
jgi:hypothetical protein